MSLFPDSGSDAPPDEMPETESPPDIDDEEDRNEVPLSLLDALDRAGGPPAMTLFLALEDARQESRFFAPYPGALSVLSDLYRSSASDALREARPLGQFALAAFMLIAPDRSRSFLRTLVPAQYQDKFDGLVGQLDHGLSGVVRGQLVICGINGFFTGIGLVVLGVPFAITLTVIAMVFSLIPIFGVLISSIPIALMALSVSFSTAAMMMLWILMVHFIEGNFLNPKIMGDSSKIHPVLVIFALMVGQYSAGVLGALIAVPVFSLVQSSFLYLKSLAETWETAP